MAQAPRDQNFVTTLLATSNADGLTPVILYADPSTHSLLISGTIAVTESSVGLTGSAIPTSATLMGASDGTNLRQLLVESSTQLNLRTTLYSAGTKLIGQQAMAASLPVTIASDQLALAVTSTNATAANLKAQVVSGDQTGAAVPANAYYEAGIAKTALPTAATDGNLTGVMMDKFGRQVVVNGAIRDLRATQTTTISASTAETTIVSAGAAGVFNDIVSIVVSNTSAATNTRIDFRDATAGTIIFSLQSPGNQTVGFSIPGESVPQTTAANNWSAQCATSTTDIRIFVLYEKNK